MTFEELLNYPVVSMDNDIQVLFGHRYNHVPEIEDAYSLDYCSLSKQDKIEIHWIKNHSFDGRRVWWLFKVIFEDRLVMLCKNAGREGEDEYDRAVFDSSAYNKMLEYIRTFVASAEDTNDSATLGDNAYSFYEFYGYNLNGHFDFWT